MWKELKDTALLGTERRQINTELLPQEIQSLLENDYADEEETRLLEALAVYNSYRESGKKTEIFNGDFSEEIPGETKEYAPQEITNMFSSIQEMDVPLSRFLFNMWLDSLIKNNKIISPQKIIELLHYAEPFPNSVKKKVVEIIGNKGKNIIPYLPHFALEETKSLENVWNEGTTNQRKDVLAEIIKMNPEQALDLVKSTWKEESISVKSAFLKIIRTDTSGAFLAFVEECYTNEFAFKVKEKVTEKQNRTTCAEILLMHEYTALCRSTHEALLSYISVQTKKKLLGLSGTKQELQCNLPDNADSFWNEENMIAMYGFETKNYDYALFNTDVLFWFSCIISSIDLNAITNMLNTDIATLANALLTNQLFVKKIKGKDTPILQDVLITNAENTRNSELALALAKALPYEKTCAILPLLPKTEYETYIRANNLSLNVNALKYNPFAVSNETWSLDFSQYIINRLHGAFLEGKSYSYYSIGKEIALYIHTDSQPLLSKLHHKTIDTPYFDVWTKHVHDPIFRTLSIKKTIE